VLERAPDCSRALALSQVHGERTRRQPEGHQASSHRVCRCSPFLSSQFRSLTGVGARVPQNISSFVMLLNLLFQSVQVVALCALTNIKPILTESAINTNSVVQRRNQHHTSIVIPHRITEALECRACVITASRLRLDLGDCRRFVLRLITAADGTTAKSS